MRLIKQGAHLSGDKNLYFGKEQPKGCSYF